MKKLREVSFYDNFITNFHKNMYIKNVRRLSQWAKEIWPTSRRELGLCTGTLARLPSRTRIFSLYHVSDIFIVQNLYLHKR